MQLGDPRDPAVRLLAGFRAFAVRQQRLQEQPRVGDDAEVRLEDLAQLRRLDVDVDELPLAPVDVQRAGVPVAEPRADRQHQVGLQKRGVAVALRGLHSGDAGEQRVVLVDRALAHQGHLDRDVEVLGEFPELRRRPRR